MDDLHDYIKQKHFRLELRDGNGNQCYVENQTYDAHDPPRLPLLRLESEDKCEDDTAKVSKRADYPRHDTLSKSRGR